MSSKVVVLHCDSYAPEPLRVALERGFELLGGIRRFAQPGERILLKPNILAGNRPEDAVTTHPAVLEGLVHILRDAGVRVSCGDSPGIAGIVNSANAVKGSGLPAMAEKNAIPFENFESGSAVQYSAGRIQKRFQMARAVQECDALFSVPKMKTHQLTRITGAVKNQFGCIPGLAKPALHVRYPDVTEFSRMLIDLNRLIRPRISIMDGILAMEGNGPRNGDPTPMNVLIMSADPVAVDATFCRLIDLDPGFIPTNVAGREGGLGTFREDEIVTIGDPLPELRQNTFKIIRRGVSTNALLKYYRPVRNLLVPRPVINQELCQRCGVCVKACPLPEKALQFRCDDRSQPPVYEYNRCIRCYCCQEMCPYRAIDVKTPLLGRLIFG